MAALPVQVQELVAKLKIPEPMSMAGKLKQQVSDLKNLAIKKAQYHRVFAGVYVLAPEDDTSSCDGSKQASHGKSCNVAGDMQPLHPFALGFTSG